jgi:sulfotransferase family protein
VSVRPFGRELSGLTPTPCPPGWEVGPPDFVGVGAQRSGTTWWYELITAHPQVVSPGPQKELHFFTRFWNESVADADIGEYHQFFPRPAGKAVGEWSPFYMYESWTPRFLAAAAPDARILVMLRDPVDRYRSDIVHYVNAAARDGRSVTGYRVSTALTTAGSTPGIFGSSFAISRGSRP